MTEQEERAACGLPPLGSGGILPAINPSHARIMAMICNYGRYKEMLGYSKSGNETESHKRGAAKTLAEIDDALRAVGIN